MRTQTKTKEVWLTQAQYDARQTAGTLVEGVVYHITDSKIAKSELASDVQTSLGKADSAIQSHQDISGKENTSNKTTTLTASSTTTQYPSAKTVYDAVLAVREIAEGKKDTYVISDVTNPSFNTQNTQVTIDKTQTTITDINGNVVDYTKMQVGDSVYITQTDVPDRWVSSMVGNNITFDKLETAKVPVLDVKVNGTTVVNNSVANLDFENTIVPALAKNIKGLQADNTAKFIRRTTAGTTDVESGSSELDVIKGNSVVWNQLVDENTSSVTIPSGHKYLFRNSTLSTTSIITSDGSAISVVGGSDVVIDLTQTFGAGNEPSTVAEFEALYGKSYYPYNAGQVLHNTVANFVTNGFNQWDEEWEMYTSDSICSKNYIDVLPNTNYHFTNLGTDVYVTIRFYDDKNNVISTVTTIHNGSNFLTPSNCCKLKFNIHASYGTTYNHDICINLSHSGDRNGQYESHWESRLPLNLTTIKGKLNGTGNSVTIFPEGMAGKGTAYDSIVTNDNGLAIGAWRKFGKRAYESGDENDSTLITDKTNTYYPLSSPEYYVLDEPFETYAKVDDYGMEWVEPIEDNQGNPTTAPFSATIKYGINVADTVKNLPHNYRTKEAQDVIDATKASTSYVDEQIARAINPKDLSYYDIYGIYTLTRNTANCYVVSNQGKYMFPLVYGNAIKNGQTNAASYTNGGGQYQAAFVNYNGVQITNPYIEIDTNTSAVSAELCLADANNIFTGVSLQTINGLKYVVFNVASVPHTGANGIIGVKDANGDIMWSWHIWVWEDSLQTVEFTNHTGVKYNMLPVNLASTWDDDTKTHIKNWHYQWGRKDPMSPPAAYNSNTNATLYGSKTFEATSADTVAEAIKRPHNFFKQYDTTSYNWNPLTYFWNFWNAICNSTGASDNLATAVKTIYDPCPYGFIIPVGRTFTGFTTTGGNSSTQSEFNVVDGFTHGWKFKANSADAVGQFFPASGSRNRESGGLGDVGSLGYYWSSASGSQAYEYRLYFNIGNVFTLNDEPRTGGFSVRPCKEYSL